jgi:hypothetical protein
MGFWDLDEDPKEKMRRIPTPLVDQFRALVQSGSDEVGRLSREPKRMEYVS